MADRSKQSLQRRETPASRNAGRSVPAKITELTPVEFVESSVTTDLAVTVDLAGEGFKEAPSSLTPTANWTTPGEFIEGEYRGMQEEVGPNASRLYNFLMPDGQYVAVWGGTVLDNRMDQMQPPIGSIVKIVYVGDGAKKPGQNPPRIFALGWKNKS